MKHFVHSFSVYFKCKGGKFLEQKKKCWSKPYVAVHLVDSAEYNNLKMLINVQAAQNEQTRKEQASENQHKS